MLGQSRNQTIFERFFVPDDGETASEVRAPFVNSKGECQLLRRQDKAAKPQGARGSRTEYLLDDDRYTEKRPKQGIALSQLQRMDPGGLEPP